MCFAEVGLGLTLAESVLGFGAQKNQAAAQNAAYQSNALKANQSATEQYYQTTLAQIQEEAKAVQEKIANRADVIDAQGKALASSQNSGASTSMVLKDIEREGAKADNITDINTKNARTQAMADKDAVKMQAQNRIDSMEQATEPSLAQAAISGLGAVAGYGLKQPSKTNTTNTGSAVTTTEKRVSDYHDGGNALDKKGGIKYYG